MNTKDIFKHPILFKHKVINPVIKHVETYNQPTPQYEVGVFVIDLHGIIYFKSDESKDVDAFTFNKNTGKMQFPKNTNNSLNTFENPHSKLSIILGSPPGTSVCAPSNYGNLKTFDSILKYTLSQNQKGTTSNTNANSTTGMNNLYKHTYNVHKHISSKSNYLNPLKNAAIRSSMKDLISVEYTNMYNENSNSTESLMQRYVTCKLTDKDSVTTPFMVYKQNDNVLDKISIINVDDIISSHTSKTGNINILNEEGIVNAILEMPPELPDDPSQPMEATNILPELLATIYNIKYKDDPSKDVLEDWPNVLSQTEITSEIPNMFVIYTKYIYQFLVLKGYFKKYKNIILIDRSCNIINGDDLEQIFSTLKTEHLSNTEQELYHYFAQYLPDKVPPLNKNKSSNPNKLQGDQDEFLKLYQYMTTAYNDLYNHYGHILNNHIEKHVVPYAKRLRGVYHKYPFCMYPFTDNILKIPQSFQDIKDKTYIGDFININKNIVNKHLTYMNNVRNKQAMFNNILTNAVMNPNKNQAMKFIANFNANTNSNNSNNNRNFGSNISNNEYNNSSNKKHLPRVNMNHNRFNVTRSKHPRGKRSRNNINSKYVTNKNKTSKRQKTNHRNK